FSVVTAQPTLYQCELRSSRPLRIFGRRFRIRALPLPLFPREAPPMSVSKETLAKLTKFDTPTICNVIELFDIRPRNRGYMDGRIRAGFPELPPMVGFASTACFRSDAA